MCNKCLNNVVVLNWRTRHCGNYNSEASMQQNCRRLQNTAVERRTATGFPSWNTECQYGKLIKVLCSVSLLQYKNVIVNNYYVTNGSCTIVSFLKLFYWNRKHSHVFARTRAHKNTISIMAVESCVNLLECRQKESEPNLYLCFLFLLNAEVLFFHRRRLRASVRYLLRTLKVKAVKYNEAINKLRRSLSCKTQNWWREPEPRQLVCVQL